MRVQTSIRKVVDQASQEPAVARSREYRATSVVVQALGAVALGAVAIGALAIGALAIGRLAIGRARIHRLEIDELVVQRLRVVDRFETPSNSAPEN